MPFEIIKLTYLHWNTEPFGDNHQRPVLFFSRSVYFFCNGFASFFYFLRLAYRPSAVHAAALAVLFLLLRAPAFLLLLLLGARARRTEHLWRSRTPAAVCWFVAKQGVGRRASTS